ncbi:MarR family transcriptional regulator [Micromonospora sp. WMMA1363]|uniref:LexA family protein n=1 Tax=Micromonospora sp. WMMA1363 TaxID=3053985 RepID=UPI00259D2B5E|nr:MarR family transcriptional regulator [Micromonospora sp. WMMA1363]MDM4723356.1 MarR family transcriptional regulator [Micromonospora sp. WMMA1363]
MSPLSEPTTIGVGYDKSRQPAGLRIAERTARVTVVPIFLCLFFELIGYDVVMTNAGVSLEMLTDRQRQVLDAVSDEVERNGYPPTVRQIAERVGLRSPSSVTHHLTRLQELGLLERAYGKPRAVDICPAQRQRRV